MNPTMKNTDLEHKMQRAQRYWYVDGFTEISFSLILLLLALYFWMEHVLPPNSTLATLLNAGFVLLVFGAALLLNKLVMRLKMKLTYPRTGYVAYRQTPRRTKLAVGIAGGLVGSLFAGMLASMPQALFLIHTASGLLIGLALLYVSYRFGLLRYAVLGGLSACLGIGLGWLGLEVASGSALYYGAMSAAFLLTGLGVLTRYLISTEAASSDEEA